MNQKAFFLKLVLLFFVIIFISGCGYEEEPNLLIDDTKAINNPPDAPISCSISDTTAFSISLSWNVATDSDGAITGYNIYMSTTSGSDYTLHGNTTETVYTVENLNGNTTYYFVVTAVDNDGTESIYSSEFNTTTLNNPPEAPTDLIAANPTGASIDLSWSDATDSDGTVTGYNIYITTTSGFNYVNIGSSVDASYTATNLDGNTMYYFVVTAVDNDSNESVFSSEANELTMNNPPNAPTGLNAGSPTDSSFNLTWDVATDPDGLTSHYNIYFSTTSGFGYILHGTSVNTNYNVDSLDGNTTYYCVITAVDNDSDESGNSNEVNATTLDIVAPTILSVNPEDGSKVVDNLNNIDITYSEIVTGADSIGNYTISGEGAGNLSIFSVSDLGNNVYRLTITGSPNDGPVLLTISNVTDISGNELSGNTITYSGWWNLDWSNRRKITFDNTGQSEDLLDFPVLIRLNSSRIDYNNTQDSGEDIRFIDSDRTELSYEIEEWDESGDSIVWVKIPQIDNSSNSDSIWMYYGNESADDDQNSSDVWDANFELVMHLNELAGDFNDSTTNDHNGTLFGGVTRTSSGKVGNAVDFDGTSGYIALDMSYSGAGAIPEITVLVWFSTNYFGGGYNNNWAFVDFDRSDFYDFYITGDTGALEFSTNASSVDDFPAVTPSLNNGSWHMACAVYDGTDKIIYLNGNEDGRRNNAHSGASLGGSSTRWGFIGDGSEATTFNGTRNNIYYDGFIDEVRISNVARSADWIAAQHLSMTDSFNSYGDEE